MFRKTYGRQERVNRGKEIYKRQSHRGLSVSIPLNARARFVHRYIVNCVRASVVKFGCSIHGIIKLFCRFAITYGVVATLPRRTRKIDYSRPVAVIPLPIARGSAANRASRMDASPCRRRYLHRLSILAKINFAKRPRVAV